VTDFSFFCMDILIGYFVDFALIVGFGCLFVCLFVWMV